MISEVLSEKCHLGMGFILNSFGVMDSLIVALLEGICYEKTIFIVKKIQWLHCTVYVT
jgi:hypothetical protein